MLLNTIVEKDKTDICIEGYNIKSCIRNGIPENYIPMSDEEFNMVFVGKNEPEIYGLGTG
jgi:hypothetical protein